ncbi:unnamed protein product [Caenorhabditis angaria]|uniref:DUF148 domain-containing protein n=1 Tax=Caenorhabditis angaria TaxID=860376 RepID=A0A9P1N417_9PELO|nr:unnamed protein product [Caenorhabditis angaria]
MRFQKSAVLFLVLLIFLECEAFRTGRIPEDQETVEVLDEDQESGIRNQESEDEDQDQETVERSDESEDKDQDQDNPQESGVRNQESEDEDQDQENPQESGVRNQESEDEDQDQENPQESGVRNQESEDEDQDQENNQESGVRNQESEDEDQDQENPQESEEDRSAEINSELKNFEKELDKNTLSSNYPQLFHPHKKYKLLSTIHENHPKIIGEGKNWLEKVGRKIEEFLSGRDFDEEDAEQKSKLFHNTSEHLLEILETCLQIYHPMLELGAKKSKLSKFCLEQVAKQRLEEVQELHKIQQKKSIRPIKGCGKPLVFCIIDAKQMKDKMKKRISIEL